MKKIHIINIKIACLQYCKYYLLLMEFTEYVYVSAPFGKLERESRLHAVGNARFQVIAQAMESWRQQHVMDSSN
jgi:hypothetical protein